VKAAREKGFNNDITGIDDRPVLRKILGYLEGLYKVSPPGLIDHFSIFIPLLSMLSTVRSYMRGIKITTNTLTKKLVAESSLLGLDRRPIKEERSRIN
jgi:hypothetical protein